LSQRIHTSTRKCVDYEHERGHAREKERLMNERFLLPARYVSDRNLYRRDNVAKRQVTYAS
jgi:hypothetical protein